METTREWELISLIEEEVINEQMPNGYDIKQSEPSINSSLELGMLGPVHPLEHWQHEYGNSQGHCDNLIHQRHLQIAIHTVVQWRKRTPRNQHANAGVVESTEYGIWFYLEYKNKLLLDMG